MQRVSTRATNQLVRGLLNSLKWPQELLVELSIHLLLDHELVVVLCVIGKICNISQVKHDALAIAKYNSVPLEGDQLGHAGRLLRWQVWCILPRLGELFRDFRDVGESLA